MRGQKRGARLPDFRVELIAGLEKPPRRAGSDINIRRRRSSIRNGTLPGYDAFAAGRRHRSL